MEDSKSASTKRQNLLPTTNGGQYVRAAYFTNWSTRLTGRARYEPKKHYLIGLCTHIHYAFATINSDNTVSASEPYDLNGFEKTSNNTMEESFGLYERVNGLKLFDGGLKTLISIGNRGRDTEPFKRMTSEAESLQTFVGSAVSFARKHGFDGIDIVWTFPKDNSDMKNFSMLLSDLRQEIEVEAMRSGQPKLLLTAMVSPLKEHIENGYEIPAVARSVDYVLLAAYDFHGPWEPKTDLHAPLLPRPNQKEGHEFYNVDSSAKLWIDGGMPPAKIVIGIPTFGRGWTLADPEVPVIGSEGKPSKPTSSLKEEGISTYYEICDMLSQGARRLWQPAQQACYLVHDNQWISYDDVQSVHSKMKWLKEKGCRGAFVWTLEYDDFSGQCASSKGIPYPLIGKIAKDLGNIDVSSLKPIPDGHSVISQKPSEDVDSADFDAASILS